MTPAPKNKMLARCRKCKTRARVEGDVYCLKCRPETPGYTKLHPFDGDGVGADGRVRRRTNGDGEGR